jgi:hypothetical protein
MFPTIFLSVLVGMYLGYIMAFHRQQDEQPQQERSCQLYKMVSVESCTNLPISHQGNVITFGWQSPAFDECSIGVFLPRAGVQMTEGAKAAIKSVLYFRTTPITFYIVVNEKSRQNVVSYFTKAAFPFVRVVLCELNDVLTRLDPATARRGHGGSHPFFVLSYMVAHIWALPHERVMITTASDQVHMVDVADVYAQFLHMTSPHVWYGAIRGHYLDMWRNKQTSLGPQVQGMANAQIIHVSAILADERIYMDALRAAIATLKVDHGYGDMDIMSALQYMKPDRVATLGCYSMVDTAMLFHIERGTFCESIPRSVHMNVQSVFVNVGEDVRFISLVMETMRSIPEHMLSNMCPYQVSQSGERWQWAPHRETWTDVGKLHHRKDGRNSPSCKACLG